MNRFAIAFFAGLIVLNGCAKKNDAAQSSPEPSPSLQTSQPAPEGEPDTSAALVTLTQALRKYSLENRRVPASLDELVRAGYVRTIPTAPRGKKFAINPKRVEVVLVNE